MEISKSTPYVRYRENISSSLHKGTVHIESEYLDRERKTTIESIEGQTWQNVVVQENKEEDLLPRLVLSVDGNTDIIDTKEERMPIDVIHGYTEPIANEDGTYTYEVSTMEGSYAQTYDGVNNIVSSSDGLEAQMSVTYATNEDNISSSVSMNGESSYTITDSYNGEIDNAILKGSTKYRDIDTGEVLDAFEDGRNLELVSVKMPSLTTTGKNLFDGELLQGVLDDNTGEFSKSNNGLSSKNYLNVSENTIYTISKNIEVDVETKIFFYDDGKRFIKYQIATNSFTTPSNCKFIKIRYYKPNIVLSNHIFTQLEQGSSATSYEPFKSNILSTPSDLELRGIGDVQDTLDLATGELTQRIGEVVLDGSEDWDLHSAYSTDEMDVYWTQNNFLPSNSRPTEMLCDKLSVAIPTVLNSIRTNGNGAIFIGLPTGTSIESYLQSNQVTVQYLLTEPIITQVDPIIKNQDGKLVPKLSTYPTTTHINLSSNGLIPSADINYTLLKSTGEASGTSIQFDNGKASDLISGIVYGESLVNALPSPSLKNSMSNVSMQKLNNGYDNINVVDGDVKGATIYGDTLVNHLANYSNSDGVCRATINNHFEKDKKYFIRIVSNPYTITNRTIVVSDATYMYVGFTINAPFTNTEDRKYNQVILDLQKSDGSKPTASEINENVKILILEYQEGMENWNIPYFEGMQSVKMPSLTTTNNKYTFSDFEVKPNSRDNVAIETYKDNRSVTLSTNYGWGRIRYNVKHDDNVKYNLKFDYNATKDFVIDFNGSINLRKSISSGTGSASYDFIAKGNEIIQFAFPGGGTAELTNIEFSLAELKNEPYTSTTLTVNEEISLHKIGDVQDELNLSTGKLTQRIAYTNDFVSYFNIKVFDRGFTIGEDYHIASIASIFDNNSLVKKPTSDNSLAYSNLFSVGVGSQSEDVIIMSDGSDYCRFKIKNGLLTKLGYSEDSSGALLFLKENPIECLMTLKTPTTKTISTSIVDQDGATQPKLQSYANGYISTSSQGLLPSVNYEVPTNNSYYLDLVKTNTQYTSKGSSDCNATIDGNTIPLSANGTFTTPSTITDNLMVLDAQVDDLMFIEGDLTGKDVRYFTGISSVENPSVNVYGKNLLELSSLINTCRIRDNGYYIDVIHKSGGTNYNLFSGTFGLSAKQSDVSNFIKLKPNTTYILSMGAENNVSIAGSIFNLQGDRIGGTSVITTNSLSKTFTTTDDAIYFAPVLATANANIVNTIIGLQLEEGTVATSYEPYNGTQLSTTPQITLNGIGDVKDEWDVVNETVTRKVGKVVLDGSEEWNSNPSSLNNTYDYYITLENKNSHNYIATIPSITINDDKFGIVATGFLGVNLAIRIERNKLTSSSIESFKQWLSENPLTVYYELATPTTESVRITPQNPQESTTSITLDTALQKVGNVTDQLRWNPYKGHYVRYNYIQDGVASDTYTIENLTSLNERKYVKLYNERTYIDIDHSIESRSYGISIPTIAEQGKQYQVRWDYIEAPSVDTIKVDLCGNVKEIPSTDNSVVIDVDRYIHSFVQIQAEGLTGKITNVMVIETVNGEIPDVDFFSGIQCVGNVVQVDGVNKAEIIIEQTNGNLIDVIPTINNNGNNVEIADAPLIRPNKNYILKTKSGSSGGSYCVVKDINKKTLISINIGANETTEIKVPYNGYYARIYKAVTSNGSVNMHYPFELCYADMAKDGIRPRYYDKESFVLPQKLCRVGEVYDNLYYDDLKGYYRIQQSIGHKYFIGESSELWNMETTDGYRTIKFTCTNANIDMRAMGATMCNGWKHLANINTDTEGFIIYNGTFVIRVDNERLNASTIVAFKEYLASNPIHLFYQLKTPTMVDLTQYPKRIELNTYRDEIFTFLKGLNPTRFTLSVPFDKTYRFDDRQEGQGYANRVTITDERISQENVVAIQEVRGQGIANIIEDANNIPVTPQPNYSGKATSHTLNNTKPATINIHGFEPSGDTKVGTYSTTDKAYQIKVMSGNDAKSLSDYYVLNLPYQLETYADGTKDKVYYNEAYKEWHFMGATTKSIEFTSGTGVFAQPLEVFRGLAPRTGMIAEFKLRFDGTSNSSRFYYSLDGVSYSYGSIRNIVPNQDIYVAFFNTGGIKLDYATKVGADSTYDNISQIANYIPECLYINQIQTLTSCEVTIDKQYIYSELKAPISLETYDGTTKVYMDGNATDTNIIMNNDCLKKVVNTYPDVEYTVYWKYLSGDGKLTITLGGTKVEVDGTQEYATIRTQSSGSQELLYVGGYNLSIQDLMVVKGAKIDELAYFENSRQVGTLVLDEEGNKSYKITLVQGGSVLEQRDNDTVAFKDDNKHNVVVHKIVGVCPTKVD